MTVNEPRNTAFEEFVRTNPDVKKLATVWRGSEEYDAWMQLYIDQDTDFVKIIENEQVATFYRPLNELELKKQEEPVAEEPTAPTPNTYEVLGVVHEHSDEEQTHKVTHVRLSNPRWFPVKDQFAWVEYVLVDQYAQRISVEPNPAFTHYSTNVYITDKDCNDYTEDGALPVFTTPAFIEVWEALWALGEIPVAEKNEGEN